MNYIVCGGRDYQDREFVFRSLDRLAHRENIAVTAIIHGDATGADRLARDWAIERGIIHVAVPAPWKKYGKPAGPMRNKKMLELNAVGLVAFPGGRGTEGMVELAKEAGLPVWRPAPKEQA